MFYSTSGDIAIPQAFFINLFVALGMTLA